MSDREVFIAALQIDDSAQRAAYLEQACTGNPPLRQRVERLLGLHDEAGSFLDKQAVEQGANAIPTRDEEAAKAMAAGIDSSGSPGPGTLIGPYKLLQQIGEGGMGTVWMAQQTEPMRRTVALKVIKAGMDSAQVLARFDVERQALALMDHPNIARVLDAGTTCEGRPFFVMELVKGIPITKFCDDHQLTPRERLELFVPVCLAIQHAHQKGIIHRDIKPSNVLVASYDAAAVPKVIDFGVAKATGQQLTERTLFTGFGAMIGTLEYMSPEQAQFNALDIDTRSDVYALGVLLYELLTGTTPLPRKRLKQAALEEAMRLIREEEPPKPSTRLSDSTDSLPSVAALRKTEPARLTRLVRGDLDWLVMKALDKDRTRRYDTASALAADVQRFLHDEPVAASPPSAWYRCRKFARRNKSALRTAVVAAMVLLLATAGIGWALWDRAANQAARQVELSKRLMDTERAVDLALAKAEQLRSQALALPSTTSQEAQAVLAAWGQAEAALAQAQAALSTGTGDDNLGQRVRTMQEELDQARRQAEQHRAQLLRKEKLLRDLDEARMASSAVVDNKFDYAGGVAKYATAFASYGLDVKPGGAAGLAQRIRAEEPAVREALILALDYWAESTYTANKEWLAAELLVAAQAADDDEWRRQFRTAAAGKDRKALLSLSAQARRLALPPSSLDLLGRALQRHGEFVEAVALLRWARGRHPSDFFVHFVLAISLSRVEPFSQLNREDALGSYRAALALRPDNVVVLNNLGGTLADKKQWDEAIAACRKAIEIAPNFGGAYHNLGNALKGNNQLDEAIAAYRKAIEIDPKLIGAHLNLGGALAAKDQLDEAIVAYRKAIAINPNNAILYNNLGMVLQHKNQLDEAIAAYRKAIDIDPTLVKVYLSLGGALAAKDQLDEAIAAYRKAIDVNPKNAQAYNNLGLVLQRKHKLEEAIAAFRKGIEIDPKLVGAYYNLGNVLTTKNQLEEAIAAFRKAVDINPKLMMAHNNLGVALYRNNQLELAIAAYRKAIEVGPATALAYNGLGAALSRKNELDEAIVAYRKAIEIDPNYAQAYYNLGIALAAKKDLDEAIAAYRKAIELAPKSAATHNSLAWLLATNPEPKGRDAAQAVDLAKKAVKLAPMVGSFWNTLGVAHYRAGDWKAARAALDKSLELTKGGNASDWFFLAMTHWQLGDKEEARKWHDRAVEWMEKNNSQDQELRRFRAEAAELLGMAKQPKSKTPLGADERE